MLRFFLSNCNFCRAQVKKRLTGKGFRSKGQRSAMATVATSRNICHHRSSDPRWSVKTLGVAKAQRANCAVSTFLVYARFLVHSITIFHCQYRGKCASSLHQPSDSYLVIVFSSWIRNSCRSYQELRSLLCINASLCSHDGKPASVSVLIRSSVVMIVLSIWIWIRGPACWFRNALRLFKGYSSNP